MIVLQKGKIVTGEGRVGLQIYVLNIYIQRKMENKLKIFMRYVQFVQCTYICVNRQIGKEMKRMRENKEGKIHKEKIKKVNIL